MSAIGRAGASHAGFLRCDVINRRGAQAAASLLKHRERVDGSQLHVGNGVAAGDVFPMIIVRVWGSEPTSGISVEQFPLPAGAPR